MRLSYAAVLACEIAGEVQPLLQDVDQLDRLGAITERKGEGHTAHEIDNVAESILFRALERDRFDGTVYSEERGLVQLGEGSRLLVCDPYCNTSLTFRGIRESAVALYEYGLESGSFTSGAIADLQVPRVIWAERGSETYVTKDSRVESSTPAVASKVKHVEEAFVVVSLLKRRRRENLPTQLVRRAKFLTTIDGAIVAARIAAGEVDGFVDAAVGQPSYEVLAYELVARAGGVVSSPDGTAIDFAQIARQLARGRVQRHTVVAAANPSFHRDLLACLAS